MFHPFSSNSGPFSPLVRFIYAGVNKIIVDQSNQWTKTHRRRWFWCDSKLTQEAFVYGVNVSQPQSEPATRCIFELKKRLVAMDSLYSGMWKGTRNVQWSVGDSN